MLLLDPEVLFACQDRQLQTAGDAEFPVNIAEMALHSFLADGELASNLAVAAAFLDGRDDLNFARCQSKATGALPRFCP
jgi:hypothetical protein